MVKAAQAPVTRAASPAAWDGPPSHNSRRPATGSTAPATRPQRREPQFPPQVATLSTGESNATTAPENS
jgi:hypothetical protein